MNFSMIGLGDGRICRWRTMVALFLLFGLLFGLTALGLAQGEEDPIWQPPINLSQSGVATEPQVVVDFAGKVHALWREDEIHGFVYTHEDSIGGWTRPLQVELPFATRLWFSEDELRDDDPTPLFDPLLTADETGRIHAFWKNNDAELLYSQVGANNFADIASWTEPVKVADAATAVAVQVDNSDQIHLVYINPLDTAVAPSGIYYQRSSANQPAWSEATLLSDSTYFRAMPEADVNLQLIAMPNGGILVGWENPVIDHLFLINSADRGQTWGNLRTVDRRMEDDRSNAQGPAQLGLTSAGDTMHAFWQAGHENELCNQYHNFSVDGGKTWSSPEVIHAIAGCPVQVQTVGFQNRPTLVLLAVMENETNMMAWDGSSWSLLQDQSYHLRALQDSDTFQTISLACQKSFLIDEQRLVITGCNGEEGNPKKVSRDNWLVERPLLDIESWFAPPSIWSELEIVTPLSDSSVNLRFNATENSKFQAFWQAKNVPGIHYGLVQKGQSPRVTTLFDDVTQLVTAVDDQNQTVIAWPDESGQLLFSKVDANKISLLSDWSDAQELPIPRAGVSQATIGVAPDGQIVVVYVLPVNEKRGVYFTLSKDEGESWAEPVRIFDAEAANWTAVGNPHLTFTYPNHMHLTWMHTDASGEVVQGLYYTRSTDQGLTWSEPENVEGGAVRLGSAITWHDVVGFGERIVHRLRQTTSNGRYTIWHQYSTDDGASWSNATNVTGDFSAGDTVVPVALTFDDSGRLFLVSAAADRVRQHMWQGERWIEGEALMLPEMSTAVALDAAFSSDNKLGMIVALRGEDIEGGDTEIVFTNAPIITSALVLPTLPALTLTPSPTPTMTPTPGPQPTPTIVFPTEPNSSWQQSLGLPAANNTITQILYGIIPAFLFVLIIFLVGSHFVRRRS